MAQISLAWVLHQDAVDAPIVGTTDVQYPKRPPKRSISTCPKATSPT
jgi:hypothetical protein